MAKVLIIDAYNLIGAQGNKGGDRARMESVRSDLVRDLEIYASGRDFSEVVVVFDGYPTERDLFLIRNGLLTVRFSEGATDADEVIRHLAGRYRERAAVVSSDRELVRSITASGSESITSQGFLSRFERRLLKTSPVSRPSGLSVSGFDKDEADPGPGGPPFREKKGNPRRLSKKDRARKRLLDKL